MNLLQCGGCPKLGAIERHQARCEKVLISTEQHKGSACLHDRYIVVAAKVRDAQFIRSARGNPVISAPVTAPSHFRGAETTPRGSFRNQIRYFDQAAAKAAALFRFLRQPSRPSALSPVAKSGRAAGRGVASMMPPDDTGLPGQNILKPTVGLL